MIIEVNEAGEIVIPAELVQAAPHTRLEAGREGDSLVLKPVADQSTFHSQSFEALLPLLEGRLVDPMMTIRREDIYGADGR